MADKGRLNSKEIQGNTEEDLEQQTDREEEANQLTEEQQSDREGIIVAEDEAQFRKKLPEDEEEELSEGQNDEEAFTLGQKQEFFTESQDEEQYSTWQEQDVKGQYEDEMGTQRQEEEEEMNTQRQDEEEHENHRQEEEMYVDQSHGWQDENNAEQLSKNEATDIHKQISNESDDLTKSYREYLDKIEANEQEEADQEFSEGGMDNGPRKQSTETSQLLRDSSLLSLTEGTGVSGQHMISPSHQYKNTAATVRFLLMPSQQVATVRFNLNQTVTELKQQIATEMKINPQVILLMFEGKKVPDESTLVDLGVHPNGTIQLQLHSVDPINHPIQAFRPRQDYHMPDVITVRIPIDNQRSHDVVVEILKETTKKPWLGGYRDKKRQTVYHHAAVQTMPKPRPPPSVEQFSRDTQTSEQKNITQQTTNGMSTQMTKIGTYVSCVHDKVIIPGHYKSADEFHSTRIIKAIIIQKYYRRWMAKRRVARIREAEKGRREWEKQEEILKKLEKEARIRREYERRMNPKSKEDFNLLYHALEKWRKEEEERINSTLSGAERKAALYMLLEQETQLIASIGRHKIEADSENKNKLTNDFLEKAAAPKRWRGRDGKTTAMDTPYTLRAQQLKDIYNSINMKYLTQDERLDVLLTLKHTVKEHDCKLTQEIIKLIDREADLLMRGVQEHNLDGLRKRISTLFLEYIKTPLFNPEAARLLKVPQDPSVLRQNIYFCPSCTQYLPSTEFKLSSNSKTVNRCRKCIQKNNEACLRQDHSHFRYMLRHVCRTEEAFGTGSKIAFLMQENDIRYLVESVWDSQSVLSAMDDIYELVLIRWDQREEWSPWNCVLLTKEEASAHAKLENVNEAYGQEFLYRVQHKHTLAKSHFSRLPKMAEYLRSRRDNAIASTPVSAVPTLSGKRMSVTPAAV